MGLPTAPETNLNDRRWTLLALTSVGAFMTPLDGSIVAVALPKMGPLLNLSFAASLWVQAAYLLSIAVLLIPLGRLADQRGRVHFYLAGIAIFTVASLAAAFSWNGPTLILSRIVQGVGGALLYATSAAIVTSVFPAQERGRALGINVMAVYLGLSAGPRSMPEFTSRTETCTVTPAVSEVYWDSPSSPPVELACRKAETAGGAWSIMNCGDAEKPE